MGKDLKGKELGTGLSQRKDGYYVGRYTGKDGSRKQKIFLKLQDCRKWLSDSQYDDEHRNLEQPEDILMDAWYDYWMSLKKSSVRENTIMSYETRYKKNIKPVLGEKRIKDITPLQCQIVLTKMSDEGKKTSTIKKTKLILHSILELALQSEIIPRNPCNGAVKSKIGKESETRNAMSREEQKRFCNAAKGSEYELQFRFILQTGLRIGELSGLKWSDIDFRKKEMTIKRSASHFHNPSRWVVGQTKTKTGTRKIPLTSEAISILESQKKKKGSSLTNIEWKDFIFTSKAGTPICHTKYDSALDAICVKAKIGRYSVHSLRHTFATRCIEAGMMPKTLQTILGHSTIGTTMDLYVHTTDDQKQKEMHIIEDMIRVV